MHGIGHCHCTERKGGLLIRDCIFGECIDSCNCTPLFNSIHTTDHIIGWMDHPDIGRGATGHPLYFIHQSIKICPCY